MGTVIFGAGGLGREVLGVLRLAAESVDAFIVDPGYPLAPVHGVQVYTEFDHWRGDPACSFVLALGDGLARARVAKALAGSRFRAVVHPAVVSGTNVQIGAGSMFLGPASLTTDIEIGEHTLVNPGCVISHDCRIGCFVSLGPGVLLAGRVKVERGASLGVGATVAPGCTVGEMATVGAGAVVINDVPPGATVVGVPARPISRSRTHGDTR